MFAVGQPIEVRFDMSTGTVWRRGTIRVIAVEMGSNNEVIYVVRVVIPHQGYIFDAQLDFML